MDDKSRSSVVNTKSSTTCSAAEEARIQLANKHNNAPIPAIDDDEFNIDEDYDDYEDDDDDEYDDEDDQFMDDDDDLIEVDTGDKYDSNQNKTNSVSIGNQSSSFPNTMNTSLTSKNLSSSVRSNNNMFMGTKRRSEMNDEEFKFEVLDPEKIVHNMIETIKEVNQVIQLPSTSTRILLHHFRWDKEKLMERFYDGNQERLFKEAHIVNPFKSKVIFLVISNKKILFP